MNEPWLTLACWLHRFWYAIPGTWRAELFVRELWMYGGWKERKEALGRLHAYLDAVIEGRQETFLACQRGEHSFSWRQGIEPCRYCGLAPAKGSTP